MDLREYLFRNRISVTDFSNKLEYSRTHISEIMNGRRNCPKRLAILIESATKGQVSINDLLKDCKESK
jgi:DNA-binding transcriptional regulator YdaS (Cro superfamily)